MTEPAGRSGSTTESTVPPASVRPDGPPWIVLGGVLAAGTLLIAGFGFASNARAAIDQAIIATAALVAGALLGFVFGLPKTAAETGSTSPGSAEGTVPGAGSDLRFTPNTNLEQVSDWLTKILIGVGLVEFNSLRAELGRVGNHIAAQSESSLSGVAIVAQANIVAFAVLGFLSGYMWTRVHFGGIQVRADVDVVRQLQTMKRQVVIQGQLISQQAVETAETKAMASLIAKGELATPARQVGPSVDAEKLVNGTPGSREREREQWPADLVGKVEAFRDAEVDWNADPVADLFPGFPAEANGRRLEVEIVATLREALTLSARVIRTGGEPLSGTVTFLLHPTFPDRVIVKRPRKDAAQISFWAEEWFTIAAIADDGSTILTYSMKSLPGAPSWFTQSG